MICDSAPVAFLQLVLEQAGEASRLSLLPVATGPKLQGPFAAGLMLYW